MSTFTIYHPADIKAVLDKIMTPDRKDFLPGVEIMAVGNYGAAVRKDGVIYTVVHNRLSVEIKDAAL